MKKIKTFYHKIQGTVFLEDFTNKKSITRHAGKILVDQSVEYSLWGVGVAF
nr:hypothetical protein [Providencia rettgeri]